MAPRRTIRRRRPASARRGGNSYAEMLSAVSRNGMYLNKVPEQMITPEMCVAAVRQTGFALFFVPDALKTHEICLLAMRQNGLALEELEDELMTAEICLAAVKQNGLAIEFVPDELLSGAIVSTAVAQNPRAVGVMSDSAKRFISVGKKRGRSMSSSSDERPRTRGPMDRGDDDEDVEMSGGRRRTRKSRR